MTGPEVMSRLKKDRERRGLAAPVLRVVQRAIAGATLDQGR